MPDWAIFASLPLNPSSTDIQQLFYPSLQGTEERDRSQCRRCHFLTSLSHDKYYMVFMTVSQHPEWEFPDINHLLKTTKQEGKIMSIVMAHVGQWLNCDPVHVGERESNKPLLRHDLVPALTEKYGPAANQKSLELERQILIFVRSNIHEFTNYTIEHYLHTYPVTHQNTYVERFEHQVWRALLVIVYSVSGPHFKDKGLIQCNTEEPTQLDSRPTSTITQAICNFLSHIPEVSQNPALRARSAIDSLCAEIQPLVMSWAAQQCEHALSHPNKQWPPSTITLIETEQKKYQALAPQPPPLRQPDTPINKNSITILPPLQPSAPNDLPAATPLDCRQPPGLTSMSSGQPQSPEIASTPADQIQSPTTTSTPLHQIQSPSNRLPSLQGKPTSSFRARPHSMISQST
jgi:hypothetical protein